MHAVNANSCLFIGAILKWINFFMDGRETTKDDKNTDRQKC